MSEENIGRNLEVYKLRKNGMNCTEIGKLYGINQQRVTQICDKYGRMDMNKSLPLFVLLVDACKDLGAYNDAATKAYTVLERRVRIKEVSELARMNESGFNFDNLLNYRGCGKRIRDIIKLAAEKASMQKSDAQ